MVVVVKRLRTRPGLVQAKSFSDSTSTLTKETPRKRAVCFEYECEQHPGGVMTEQEQRACFYTAEEIQSFDKDRALTVLMYKTRRNAGAPWDDNVHSLRGLEEFVRKDGDKFQKRKRHIGTILKEQARLKSAAGVSDLANASRTMKKSPEELQSELLRGVSCSLSKTDKQRALSVAMKDEKASVIRTNSGRRLLGQFMTKINQWSSSRSLEEHPRSSRMLMANEGSSRNAKES